MAYLPRGITPELLRSQVVNTMPYLFESEAAQSGLGQFVPAQIFRVYNPTPEAERLSHLDYFKLCVSAHYLTCGTPVPTDVDNQIRLKLWPAELPLETALQMVDFVLESRHWDFTLVTGRYGYGAPGTPWEKEALNGHLGEWFTVAAGAYCAMRRYRSEPQAQAKCEQLLDAIAEEVHRHSEIFGSLWRAGDGLGCLKASASIAHNLGDLDRVMDMWSLGVEDRLRLGFYKLGVTPFDSERKLRYLGRLWVAGELYKSMIDGSSMALENHRHFALRKPRSLRQSRALLIPNGPFFDCWGKTVARELPSAEARNEIVEALLYGWERLPKTMGYGRALCGMREIIPSLDLGGRANSNHSMRRVLDMLQDRFERKWSDEAIKLMDDIPSRAI